MSKKKESSPKSPRVSAKTTAPKPAAAPKTARRRAAGTDGVEPVAMTLEERYRKIAEAAYFRAQARGFAPGHEVEDWLAAEREVERELRRN